MKTDKEPTVQRILGDCWKEVAEKYINKLEEKEREVWLSEQKKEEECKNRMESKPPGAEITEEEGIEEG